MASPWRAELAPQITMKSVIGQDQTLEIACGEFLEEVKSVRAVRLVGPNGDDSDERKI